MSGEARLEILSRIYKAGARTTETPAPPISSPATPIPQAEVVDQFADYASEYRATVTRCLESDLPQTLSRLFGPERVILPPGLPFARLPDRLPDGIDTMLDSGQDHRELSRFDAVITGCRVAIAETGTVVLDHGPGQGRRALTLIPDHHVCVVFEHQVTGTVAESVGVLQAAVTAGRPLTWISGPSATSDIELSRVEGVHGPRRLDIVIVRGQP